MSAVHWQIVLLGTRDQLALQLQHANKWAHSGITNVIRVKLGIEYDIVKSPADEIISAVLLTCQQRLTPLIRWTAWRQRET